MMRQLSSICRSFMKKMYLLSQFPRQKFSSTIQKIRINSKEKAWMSRKKKSERHLLLKKMEVFLKHTLRI